MKTAEYLIKKAEELGITDFFGVPGDYNFNILYEIENNPNVNWIGCTNELNAGYAADGYARIKGYGAVVTTYGAGELSAANAIGGSYAENVPVIHIVGLPDFKTLDSKKVIHHGFNTPKPYNFAEAFKQITEASTVLNRDNAKIEIDRVLKIFIKEKRPVYIAIPSDIAIMDIKESDSDYGWISDYSTLENAVNKIADKIKKSEHPIILFDSLVKRFNSEQELADLIEKSNIPSTNLLMGAGILNPDTKNYIGTYSYEYSNMTAKKYLDTTDCLIAIGTMYGDINSFGENLPYDINKQIIIQGTCTYIDGNKYENIKMKDVLKTLEKKVTPKSCTVELDKTENTPTLQEENNEENISSADICIGIEKFIKSGDTVVIDTGSYTADILSLKFPKDVTVLSQLLWCSIGWATPAAFGAGIAKPNSRIVIITGDGAHIMTAFEIGNMFKFKQKPIIMVINNNGYSMERALSSSNNSFNDIVTADFTKFARIFKNDIWASKVITKDDFEKTLRVAQIMDKPSYIEIFTDKNDIPQITSDFIESIKNKTKNTSSKKSGKKSFDFKLGKTKYETQIHANLRDFD